MAYFRLFIISFFLFSCKKENNISIISCNTPTTDKSISLQLFKGRWNWVSELYYDARAGNYILKTPATEGYNRQLVFANDHHLEFFKNNLSIKKYGYDIFQESAITLYPEDSSNVLVFKDYTSGTYYAYVHFSVCSDTLILNFQITSDIIGREKWAKGL